MPRGQWRDWPYECDKSDAFFLKIGSDVSDGFPARQSFGVVEAADRLGAPSSGAGRLLLFAHCQRVDHGENTSRKNDSREDELVSKNPPATAVMGFIMNCPEPIPRTHYLAGLLLVAAYLGAASSPAVAQSAANPSDPLWSDAPKRIDRGSQRFERLPDTNARQAEAKAARYPLRLKRTLPYIVVDSVSFVQEGKKYRLAELEPVPAAKTCKNPDGQRWACGLKARVALSRLLRAKPIRCAPLGEKDGFMLVECVRNEKDLGGTLAAAGYALTPAGKDRYRAEEEEARKGRKGVWQAEPVDGN
ncbi:thermonuclease family protein [Mesorhizobium sp. LHD-90]|uniref:thermonuclease family protein n=1 Tax=Mesorhizobium sp. LHD-90 TaxID=3071414 RepID=UPI0027E18B53|nr:thermonuclease family protein [Mesorhizobium sp. LHD-90]MDQ6432479.1 thermonuclease family protein [Mesorhizobium sp. LHD-90]